MKTWTRTQAVDALRTKLMELTDDEHCLCMVAARDQIFCGDFSQWKSGELKDRYDWIVKRRPRITRAKLEELANRWQLARQFVNDSELACDNQLTEPLHKTCGGWSTFTNEDLARFAEEMLGEELVVESTDDARS